MNHFIIKTSTNYAPINEHIAKYSNFLNSIMNQKEGKSIYLESIKDGMLYIFPNFKMAKKYLRNIEINFGEVKRELEENSDKFIQNLFLTPNKFPKKGFLTKIEVFPKKHKNQGFKLIKENFENLHSDFECYIEEDSTLVINTKSIKAIHAYFASIFEVYYDKKIENNPSLILV